MDALFLGASFLLAGGFWYEGEGRVESEYTGHKTRIQPLKRDFSKGFPLKNFTVRIIVPSGSSGTDYDAELYHQLLEGSVLCYVNSQHPEEHPEARKFYDVNLYVEKTLRSKSISREYGEIFPCREKWMMPNQEMLRLDENLEDIDVWICKTRYAKRLIEEYFPESRVIYTAHTSKDLLSSIGGVIPEKNYDLAIHPAGKSWLKGTRNLIKAWIVSDPKKSLVVTCRDYCIQNKKILRELSYEFSFKQNGKDLVYRNGETAIYFYESLSAEDLRYFQLKAGWWICPSEVEGYGHYINEGRGAGGVIITTNFPPMNELVSSENGFLIDTKKFSREGQLPGSIRTFPGVKEIAKTLKLAFSRPEEELEKKGKMSRIFYDRDKQRLQESFSKLSFDPQEVAY